MVILNHFISSLKGEMLQSFEHLQGFLWTCSNMSIFFSCLWPQSWMQHCMKCHLGVQWSDRITPSTCCLCCFGCSPGQGWFSGVWAHIDRSWQALHAPNSPSPSPQDCSQSIPHPACSCARYCPDPCATPCTWPCWTWWCLYSLTAQACQGPSGWHLFPPVCRSHCSHWCWTCWGRSSPLAMSLVNVFYSKFTMSLVKALPVPAPALEEHHSLLVSTWTPRHWICCGVYSERGRHNRFSKSVIELYWKNKIQVTKYLREKEEIFKERVGKLT